MTRGILAALCAALAVLTCIPAVAEAVEVSATACVLMDADTGQVLYEKNGDKRMLIASTTKLMTALVALELGTPSQVITVTAAHMAEGSSMYLRPGERLTLEELLYGLLLCSGNDAALALTECAGGVAPFVERMNEKAAALGMADSHFANPNGLDDEAHYSTAYDMALLGCAAVNEPTLRRTASTRTAVIGGRTLTNHNKLLSRLDGCVGLKTGYTKAAGRTLVSCVRRNGQRLVAVTLQDGDDWNDHAKMLDYGFTKVKAYPLETSCTNRVAVAGTGQSVGVYAQARTLALTPEQRTRIAREVYLPGFVYGSVGRGDRLGEIRFLLDGKVVCACPLLADSAVEADDTEPGFFETILSKLGIYV